MCQNQPFRTHYMDNNWLLWGVRGSDPAPITSATTQECPSCISPALTVGHKEGFTAHRKQVFVLRPLTVWTYSVLFNQTSRPDFWQRALNGAAQCEYQLFPEVWPRDPCLCVQALRSLIVWKLQRVCGVSADSVASTQWRWIPILSSPTRFDLSIQQA